MDGTYIAYGRNEKCLQNICSRNLKGEYQVGDARVDGKII
jgi:hypothetical protein